DAKHVCVAARCEEVWDGHRLRRVLVGLDRAAGGDLADDRQNSGLGCGGLRDQLAREAEPDRGRRREADRARLRRAALQVALPLQDLEMVVDGGGRSQSDGAGDLADRGWI